MEVCKYFDKYKSQIIFIMVFFFENFELRLVYYQEVVKIDIF